MRSLTDRRNERYFSLVVTILPPGYLSIQRVFARCRVAGPFDTYPMGLSGLYFQLPGRCIGPPNSTALFEVDIGLSDGVLPQETVRGAGPTPVNTDARTHVCPNTLTQAERNLDYAAWRISTTGKCRSVFHIAYDKCQFGSPGVPVFITTFCFSLFKPTAERPAKCCN
jgi:hypothetical protein